MKAWDQFLTHLSNTLDASAVDRWLRPMRVLRFDAANLYLESTDPFQIQWFNDHVKPRLRSEFISDNGRPIKVHLNPKEKDSTSPKPVPRKEYVSDPLQPHMTFATYIHDKPSLPVEILKKDLSYNPIYFYGPSGCGKTHLLQAYAKEHPHCLYVHAETFTEHVVHAMRTHDIETFRSAYRSVSALLIDDIHVIKKRAATQEELFHTFNHLHANGCQLIFASFIPPNQLLDIEPRLISRFEWGITLPLDPPPLYQLVQRHSDLDMDQSAIDYLLKTFTNSEDLLQALDTLNLRVHLDGIALPLTETHLTIMLKELVQNQKKHLLTPQIIVEAVAKHFDIAAQDLLGKSQAREHSIPRKIAMYFLRTKLNLPYTKIGAHFNRDHSTVITSCRAIAKQPHQHDLKRIDLLVTHNQ